MSRDICSLGCVIFNFSSFSRIGRESRDDASRRTPLDQWWVFYGMRELYHGTAGRLVTCKGLCHQRGGGDGRGGRGYLDEEGSDFWSWEQRVGGVCVKLATLSDYVPQST